MKKFLILILILLTGCYNYHELNDLAIVKGVSIDIKDNEYVLNYAICNDEIKSLEGKGKSLSEAIDNINLMSNKKLYIGHMLVYIISEDVARKGVSNITDFFFRKSVSKKTFQIIISKKIDAKDILNKMIEQKNIDEFVKNISSEESPYIINTTFLSFLKKENDQGIEPIINGITIVDNRLKIDSIAIFKDDKLIKWSNNKEIVMLLNQSKKAQVIVDNIAFSISDIEITNSFEIGNKINFKFKIIGKTKIDELNSNYDLKKESDIKILEELLINNLKSSFDKTINEIKKDNIDSIGIGNFIYQNDYNNWLKVKNNYLEKLNVEFEIIPNLLIDEISNKGVNK